LALEGAKCLFLFRSARLTRAAQKASEKADSSTRESFASEWFRFARNDNFKKGLGGTLDFPLDFARGFG